MSPEYLKIYDSYKECSFLFKKLTSFIQDVNNPLQERFNLFKQCLYLLPYGNYLSEWCITDESSPAYGSEWNSDIGWLRGSLSAERVLESILEDLYADLSDQTYEQYGDNVPLDILFNETTSNKKDYYKLQIEAILTDCKAGVLLDW